MVCVGAAPGGGGGGAASSSRPRGLAPKPAARGSTAPAGQVIAGAPGVRVGVDARAASARPREGPGGSGSGNCAGGPQGSDEGSQESGDGMVKPIGG